MSSSVPPADSPVDPALTLALAPPEPEGRCYGGERKVRLGDVDPQGRLRLDALTRYCQDVSDDDTTDAGLAVDPGWVVRSTVVDELVPAALAERLQIVTFCSGLGRSWAERRLTVTGDMGARYEIATIWICVSVDSGAPSSLTDQFVDIYGPAAAGRKVSARLANPKPPSESPAAPGDQLGDQPDSQSGAGDSFITERWPLRVVDYDIYGHVNNAAYWALVEQRLPAAPVIPRRFRMEYGRGIDPVESVSVIRSESDDRSRLLLWWMSQPDDTGRSPGAAACASVVPLPADLYAD